MNAGSDHKKLVFERMLAAMDVVCVHLHTTKPGTDLPLHLYKQPSALFEYGLALPQQIRDLEVSSWGISAGLSFAGAPYMTRVPWYAVYAITDRDRKRGFVWSTEVPSLTERLASPASPRDGKPPLRVISAPQGNDSQKPTPLHRKPTLKLVK